LKILIIRFSSIGDIVLTTPVVRVLHEKLNAEVHYLTKPAFASIVLANPHVAKVITLSEDFEKLLLMLKGEEYDHIIDLHHNLRTKRLKLALRRPSSSFYKLNFEKWLIVNFKINRLPEKHIVDRYMDTISFLGMSNDHRGLDFFIPPEKKEDKPVTSTNNSGGIQGGISNGMPIWFNVAFKPVATLLQKQKSVNKQSEEIVLEAKGRHDHCVLPRAVPIVESMAALVIADFLLQARANRL